METSFPLGPYELLVSLSTFPVTPCSFSSASVRSHEPHASPAVPVLAQVLFILFQTSTSPHQPVSLSNLPDTLRPSCLFKNTDLILSLLCKIFLWLPISLRPLAHKTLPPPQLEPAHTIITNYLFEIPRVSHAFSCPHDCAHDALQP